MNNRSTNYSTRAEYYDLEYQMVEDHSFVATVIQRFRPRNVLEIPAGSGRNIVFLSRMISEGLLVDLEEKMVTRLHDKICRLKLIGRYEAIQGDIRSFQRDSGFDFIWVPHDAMNLLGADHCRETVERLARLLSANGIFIIDLIGPKDFIGSNKKAIEHSADKGSATRLDKGAHVGKAIPALDY